MRQGDRYLFFSVAKPSGWDHALHRHEKAIGGRRSAVFVPDGGSVA